MSAVAIQQPSHSSPLRPRDSDPALRTPKTNSTTIIRASNTDIRRSMSSGASARAAGNNASRSPSGERTTRNHHSASSNGSKSPVNGTSSHPSKTHHTSSSNPNSSPNVPIIKKEQPSSPENPPHPSSHSINMPRSRHRPHTLDLTRNKNVPAGASTVGARPSAKDSAGLHVMQDVGLACLSPGFQSQDPSIQAQLQKSMDIREHQRRLIESQMGKSAGGEKSAAEGGPPASAFGKPPGSSRRKGPPPGLAIHAPSASQFASEYRAIQSAPLNQTFTGLNSKQPSSLSRQILNRQGQNADSQRSAQAPPSQPSNRLPPISDVLPGEGLGSARGGPPSGFHAPHSTYSPAHPGASATMGSPGYPPPPASAGLQPPRSHPGGQSQQPTAREGYGPARSHDFKSAEDAIQSFSGGQEDLQPRLVHYRAQQPPTPPSPRNGENKVPPTSQPHYAPRSGSGRRRTREEYERDLPEAERMDVDSREREHEMERRRAHEERRYAAWEDEHRGRAAAAAAAAAAQHTSHFGQRAHSPETNRRKKEEFMALCARAWDLFHS